MNNPTAQQPSLRAVHVAMFPTMGTPQEVIDYANAQLPIIDKNVLHSILMIYHNTLLAQVNHLAH